MDGTTVYRRAWSASSGVPYPGTVCVGCGQVRAVGGPTRRVSLSGLCDARGRFHGWCDGCASAEAARRSAGGAPRTIAAVRPWSPPPLSQGNDLWHGDWTFKFYCATVGATPLPPLLKPVPGRTGAPAPTQAPLAPTTAKRGRSAKVKLASPTGRTAGKWLAVHVHAESGPTIDGAYCCEVFNATFGRSGALVAQPERRLTDAWTEDDERGLQAFVATLGTNRGHRYEDVWNPGTDREVVVVRIGRAPSPYPVAGTQPDSKERRCP